MVKSDAEATASATRVGSEATVMTACPARVRFLKVSRRRGGCDGGAVDSRCGDVVTAPMLLKCIV